MRASGIEAAANGDDRGGDGNLERCALIGSCKENDSLRPSEGGGFGAKGWVGRRKVDLVGTEEAIMRIEGQNVL